MEVATFGMGCFWKPEELFRTTKGVLKTTVGYMGGSIASPKYEQVCKGGTGHAEVVQLEFDPKIITYEQILDLFWKNHDPTQLNRQGNDRGSQYRSVIFYHDYDQKRLAYVSKKSAQKNYMKEIETEIVPAGEFYKAEPSHQKYLMKKGSKK